MFFYFISPMHFSHEFTIKLKKRLTLTSWIMTLKDKVPVQRVQKILIEFDTNSEVIVLKSSARTAFEAAKSLNCEVGAIIKSLLFKTEQKFTLCLVAGDKKASLNKIKKILNIKDVSMASADDVKNVTGFTIGGVSPIGHSNKIDILIDLSLDRFKELFAAAGHPNCIFRISFEDLSKITEGSVKELVEWHSQNY